MCPKKVIQKGYGQAGGLLSSLELLNLGLHAVDSLASMLKLFSSFNFAGMSQIQLYHLIWRLFVVVDTMVFNS